MRREVIKFIASNVSDFSVAFLFVTSFLIFLSTFTYIYFAQDLKTKDSIIARNDRGVTLTDRFGNPFFSFYQAKRREFIPLEQIPLPLQQAAISVEDKDFYSHSGFSPKATARSIVEDTKRRDFVYGGSTITQQLVKNALLNSNKNFFRKFQEVILAIEIERRFSKNEILEMYLNSVYFGDGAFGAQEAAYAYFNKPAKDLDLPQSSFLIGLLPAPSRLSPYGGDLEAAKERQRYILEKMVEQNYISLSEKTLAENKELAFESPQEPLNSKAIFFALMAKDELIKKYGEEALASSGFLVKTTINLDWQDFAQETVAKQVQKLEGNRVSNGAAVVIDPKNGEIRAVVGSIDWDDRDFGKFNVALAPRQPGSSFKPIYYSFALENNIITPATVLKDQPVTYGENERGTTPYKPHNYDDKFRGSVLVRRALSNSLNVPSVEVISKLGIAQAVAAAQSFGITTISDPTQYGLSLALGAVEVTPLELTAAYATFANKGLHNPPTTISEVYDKQKQLIFSHQPEPKKIISPQTAFLISSILSDKNARAEVFGNLLDTPQNAAVKTGTTQNYRDSWTIGFTPYLTVGVWVGNNSGKPMDNIAGSLGAAPIFKKLVAKFSPDQTEEKFTQPPGIVSLSVCRYNGLVLKESTSSGYLEYFIAGTEPKGICHLPKPTPSPTPKKD